MGGGSDSVEVGGRTIAFERRGDGPPLLLLHGACGDSRDWRPQLDELSEEFTVVAWDAPGCGRSWDPPEDYGLAGYADCLAAFVEALGLERPHVLGLSFGSGLALELFRRHRSLPRSLVLAAAYAGWAGSLGRKVAEERRQWGLHAAERPFDEFIGDFCDTLFTASVPAEVVDGTVAVIAEFHPAGLRAMANAFADADLRERAARNRRANPAPLPRRRQALTGLDWRRPARADPGLEARGDPGPRPRREQRGPGALQRRGPQLPAGCPVNGATCAYIPTQRTAAVARSLRTPSSCSPSRAAFSLPARELARHTKDPLGDLEAGRYDPLIAAAYDEAGLRRRAA
jgi:pimeloyl-ACP methyl ester carboxylesterase